MATGFLYKTALQMQQDFAENPENKILELGDLCVRHDISIAFVAEALGVSRQTVYKYFSREFKPIPPVERKLEKLLGKLKKRYDNV